VQLDPIKPKLKPPGTKRLKLAYDGLLSNFAFKFNLRRYTKDTLDMEKKLNETVKAIPMSEFRRALENLQDAARKKLASRAVFWNYTLAKSPLETHLVGRCRLTLSNPSCNRLELSA